MVTTRSIASQIDRSLAFYRVMQLAIALRDASESAWLTANSLSKFMGSIKVLAIARTNVAESDHDKIVCGKHISALDCWLNAFAVKACSRLTGAIN
jgi:hypothetical protein